MKGMLFNEIYYEGIMRNDHLIIDEIVEMNADFTFLFGFDTNFDQLKAILQINVCEDTKTIKVK